MLTGLSQNEAVMNALLGFPMKTNSYNFKTSSNKETERMQRKFFELGICWDTYGYEIKFLDNRRFCRKGNKIYPWNDSNLVMVDIEDFIGKEDKRENTMELKDLNFKVVIPFEEQCVKFQELLFKKGGSWEYGLNNKGIWATNSILYAVEHGKLSTVEDVENYLDIDCEHYSYKQAMKLLNKLPDTNTCPFEDSEMVLMRNVNNEKWLIGLYNAKHNTFPNAIKINDVYYRQAIKYKGNEHHLNTNTNLKHWEKDNGKYIFKD